MPRLMQNRHRLVAGSDLIDTLQRLHLLLRGLNSSSVMPSRHFGMGLEEDFHRRLAQPKSLGGRILQQRHRVSAEPHPV